MDGYFSVQSNCTVDADCFGSLICYPASVEWDGDVYQDTAFCGCSTKYGLGGASWRCDEVGAAGVFTIAVDFALLLGGLGLLGLSSKDLAKIVIVSRKSGPVGLPIDAAFITQACIFVSALFYIIWRIARLCNYAVLGGDIAYDVQANGSKSRPFMNLGYLGLIVSQTAGLLAASTISVLWIEVARASKQLSRKQITGLKKYKLIVYGVNLSYLAGACIACTVGQRDKWIALMAPAYMVALSITYYVGRRKLIKLLQGTLPDNTDRNSTRRSSADSKGRVNQVKLDAAMDDAASRTMQRAGIAIKRCAFHVILASIALISSCFLFYALNSTMFHPAGWRGLAPAGTISLVTLAELLPPIAQLYATAAVTFYCHRGSQKIVRTRRKMTSFNLPSGIKSTAVGVDHNAHIAQGQSARRTSSFRWLENRLAASSKEVPTHGCREVEQV